MDLNDHKDVSKSVKVWTERINIPTYEPMPADKNPMFLDRRVYQGSSGKVYPLPFIDRISSDKTDHEYEAVWLENEYIRVMALPELGGRIHIIQDKTNGYDCIYRQDVIKPALVGLAGPWLSGGIEFNWPQHHRPATYMPMEFSIETSDMGDAAVWFSDYDPILRMQGQHCISLSPGCSCVTVRVRLNNRTPFIQTFLWWANMGVRVNEDYQSIFPPDVHYVADHAKRAVSEFPVCKDKYYGVDYSPGTRIDWFKNIPVPTSYMAIDSKFDFVGGYDHGLGSGVLHIADHHISPGKKQWTWGNSDFGSRWYKHLTDDGGRYVEIMAGVFTENQPDFSFLAPGEVKEFYQHWCPLRGIGIVKNANSEASINASYEGGQISLRLNTTSKHDRLVVKVISNGDILMEEDVSVSPSSPLDISLLLFETVSDEGLSVQVWDESRMIIDQSLSTVTETNEPLMPATEPDLPKSIPSNDELYFIGLHLWQYRHATRDPIEYWNEALSRDPGDYRCNNAMGLWHLRRGEFSEAVARFETAIARLTKRNPNPLDSEPFYNLGLAYRYLGDYKQAAKALLKAAWSPAWEGAASAEFAKLALKNGDKEIASSHFNPSLIGQAFSINIMSVLYDWGGSPTRDEWALQNDPLGLWTRYRFGKPINAASQARLDLAIEFMTMGLYSDAVKVLLESLVAPDQGAEPLLRYHLASAYKELNDNENMFAQLEIASSVSPDYCFPSRLDDMIVLEWAIRQNPSDKRAEYYLGNLFYSWGRREEAITLWENAARKEPSYSVTWRNLGLAYANVRNDMPAARDAYERAFTANPLDARLVYERDQLWKKAGVSPIDRLSELERLIELVRKRDDLTLELSSLYNLTDQPEKALDIISSRSFQPWEGGEGQALKQFTLTHINLGRKALEAGDAASALNFFTSVLLTPDNIGEAPHPLANFSDIYYWLGVAASAAGEQQAANSYWETAASFQGDFLDMAVAEYSELSYFQALSLRSLGRTEDSRALLTGMLNYAQELELTPAKIDYFATSLPTMLIFEEDLNARQITTSRLLAAYAQAGLGNNAKAIELLSKIIADDPNNASASDLARTLI